MSQDVVKERLFIAGLFRFGFTGLLGLDLDRPRLTMADLGQVFQCHVSSADGPFVVLIISTSSSSADLRTAPRSWRARQSPMTIRG